MGNSTLFFKKKFLFFLTILLSATIQVVAQSFCPQDPDPFDQQDLRLNSEYTLGECPANDIQIVGASLNTGQICNSCDSGDLITANFLIAINHNTNSGNRFLGVFADLTETRPDGSVAVCKIARSSGPVLSNNQQSGNQQVLDYGEVTFTCGSQLVLDNILLVWTAANGESPVTPQNNPNGKYCYANPVINIVPPLNAVADATCNSNNLSDVDLLVSGGKAPFSYSWTGPSGFTSNAMDLVDVMPESMYNVTVTDADGCTTTTSVTTPVCFICPTLNNESPDFSTCEDIQGQNLSVATDIENINIKFVYYSSSQSNPYSGGTQLGAIVTPTGGTATSTAGISGFAPGTYYAYAILDINDPDLSDANCRPFAESIITINPLPIAEVVGALEICSGSSTTLTASGGTSYLWGTGATTAAIEVDTAGDYTVTVTDANGCVDEETVTVIVNDNPTVVAEDASVCLGESIQLSATPAGGTWTGIGVSPTGLFDSSALAAGDYEVTYSVTDSNTCDGSDSATVMVNVLPEPVAQDASVCIGATVQLGASPEGGIWSGTGVSPTGLFDTTGLPAGDYEVTYTVTDSNTCVGETTATVTINPLPIAEVVGALEICSGSSTTLTASGGTSYLWGTGATTAAIEVDTAGDYTVTVTDANGCVDEETVTVIVNDNPTVVAEDASVCLGESIQLSATPAGGTWTGIGVSPTGLFDSSALAAGDYEVTYSVTDSNTCDGSDSATVMVNVLPEPVAQDASVCIGATVQLGASPEGGIWSGTGVSPTGLFDTTGLPAGDYEVTYTVTDSNTCVGETTATVTINPLPIAEVVGALEICSGSSTTLTASGGTGYEWSTGATTAAIEVDTAGDYTVTVTDVNGCVDEETVTVIVNDNPTVVAEDASVCLGESIQLSATPAGGTWTGIGVSPTGLFDSSALAAGGYEVTYSVTDSNTCDGSDSATVTVNVLPEPLAQDASVCLGATVQLGASPEGGIWSGTGVSPTGLFDTAGLTAGDYEVTYTVTDSNTCVGETTATVTINSLPIAEIGGTLEICSGSSTTLTASGGTGYEWSTGATTAAIEVHTAGDYTVTVTDVNGCVDEETVTVIVNDNPTVVAEDASVCLGESIQLSATPAGGTWTGIGVSPTGLFDSSALAAGDYEVTYSVTDSNTCDGSDSATVMVNVLPEPVAQDASVCIGATVQLGASPEGGIWSGTGVSPTGLFDTTGLPAGDYEVTYTVTDSNTCVGETTATVTINPLPIAEVVGALEICSGSSTTLTASGGTGYEWSTGATTAAIEVDTAGDYTVTVTDVNGCVDEETVTVIVNDNPTVVAEDASVCLGESIQLSATPAGGTWTGIGVSPTGLFDSSALAAGDYEVTYSVTDSNTCDGSDSATVMVNVLPEPVAQDASVCIGATVQLGASPEGGIWSGTGVSPTGLFDTTGLPAGDYEVTYTVTDSNTCVGETTATVTINPLPIAEVVGALEICSGSSTTLTASGGTSYLWGTGATTAAIEVDTAGDYTVTVTDANGCVDEETVTVIVNDNPTVVAEDASVCLGESIQLSATPAGGTWTGIGVSPTGLFDSSALAAGDYEVTYSVTDSNTCDGSDSATVMVNVLPEPVAQDASVCIGATVQLGASPEGGIWSGTGVSPTGLFDTTGLPAGDYEVTYTVTDSNTCVGETTATVTINPLPIAEVVGALEICSGSSTTLTASGGTSYLWGTGATTAAIEVDTAGDYTVTVTDANGCVDEETVTVIVNEKINPLFAAVEPICEGDLLEELPTVSLNGISGSWSPTLDNTMTTEYTFTPKDDECANTVMLTIMVMEKPLPLITEVTICYDQEYLWTANQTTYSGVDGSTTVIIEGGNCEPDQILRLTVPVIITCNIIQDVLSTNHLTEDGVATVYPSGGSGTYTYLWDNGETTQTASSLTSGMHSVTVTDTNGCASTCQIDIAKELYCWTNLVKNVSTNGGNDGTAYVKGNGGYRPYTFKWDDGTTSEMNTRLSAGVHYVTITDSHGATSQCSVTITEPGTGNNCSTLTSDIVQDRLATNHLTKDGIATVHVKGGTAPFTYIWDNGETTQTATTLDYGMHSVTVTDSKGCKTSSQIDIAKVLYCWIDLYAHVSVYEGNNGSAMVQGNGGYRPYTFKWDDGTTEQMNNNLSVGTHYVTITDAIGATSTCSISISQPNEKIEICDGIDNDGDGKIDEGFDKDGDGVADCFDVCNKGDDHIDVDNDGIPDACDDNICTKGDAPAVLCYQSAIWNEATCSWKINGEKPMEPETACHQTAIWNKATCTWDIIDGQPEMPMTQCYETAVWNVQTCSWEIIGEKPMEPETGCHQTAVWNEATCTWDIIDGQPEMPMTQCYETAIWNVQTCSWEIIGEKPMEPETGCHQTAVWNESTCTWDIIDGQPEMPMTQCYETAVWNVQTCSWEIIGEKPMEPETECYETAMWNETTCSWEIIGEKPMEPETGCHQTAVWNESTCTWDIIDGQPEMPMTQCYETAVWNVQTCSWEIIGEKPMEPETECYETAMWNETTCSWEIIGEKPMEPETECYETAVWNEITCQWDIEGEQPEMPITECNETAVWNEVICEWGIIENDNDCGQGTIDQCETAYARSNDENVRTCFTEIANLNGNNWGWTNEIPSINGEYELELYAAAGQCDITKGALVGNAIIVYNNGLVDVTVSVLNGYKITETQLYVGNSQTPVKNNGDLTVAPGQYPYQDDINGDFNTYTFEDISAGDMDIFYVILHANVCPQGTGGLKTTSTKIEFSAFPIPFKEELNIELKSSYNSKLVIEVFDLNGRLIRIEKDHEVKVGVNNYKLSIGSLESDMYLIIMKTDKEKLVKKVIAKK
ncbi:T9SS type A sorting domain-containing protein [Maribacter sp. MAR_2009_72]|uniref:T9SS type A sorting domain-containing protein n=1 Tax=Maribacter sp. MAR_2009_72 TaxID=1250050 RepID=UPI00119C3D82|nr:T9SS type A sorting domain-containing protein [Maribacter sp. MAR_2009_72]TVZ15043.1 putative secreted protein (Por secretion system target) [Maribacter sp. MAR_2009_72]